MLHESGIGPHGIPMRLAGDPDMDGWFEVRQEFDYAQAALERWRQEHKQLDPGAYPVVVNIRPRGLRSGARPTEHPQPDEGSYEATH